MFANSIPDMMRQFMCLSHVQRRKPDAHFSTSSNIYPACARRGEVNLHTIDEIPSATKP